MGKIKKWIGGKKEPTDPEATHHHQITVLQGELWSLQQQMSKCFNQVGEVVFQLYQQGHPYPDLVGQLCHQLVSLQTQVKAKEHQIESLKQGYQLDDLICPDGHGKMAPGSQFCLRCGKKLVVYQPLAVLCPFCGARLEANARFCTDCGEAIPVISPPPPPPPPIICTRCHKKVPPGNRFCIHCSAPLPTSPVTPTLTPTLYPTSDSSMPRRSSQTVVEPNLSVQATDQKKEITSSPTMVEQDWRTGIEPMPSMAVETVILPPEVKPADMLLVCENCRAKLPAESLFCSECGYSLNRSVDPSPQKQLPSICPNCQEELLEGSNFCKECGYKLAFSQLGQAAQT